MGFIGQAPKMTRFPGNTQGGIMELLPRFRPELIVRDLEENYLIIIPIMKWCGLPAS